MLLILLACTGAPADDSGEPIGPVDGPVTLRFDFEDGTDAGFVVDQTDFEEPTRGAYEANVGALPAPLAGVGLELDTFNNSDDQWVYIARRLGADDGVEPGRAYRATLAIALYSNTPSGCTGVGGSPDGLTIKGGVVDREPAPLPPDDLGYIGFSIDKGNQTVVGPEAVGLGGIGTAGTDCTGENPWELLEREGSMDVTATPDGELWVYVGTDSAFEGAAIYGYDEVRVTLTPG
jgi:hypothetical protein